MTEGEKKRKREAYSLLLFQVEREGRIGFPRERRGGGREGVEGGGGGGGGGGGERKWRPPANIKERERRESDSESADFPDRTARLL